MGGQLACVSAAVEHGLWVPRESTLHVAVSSTGSRLRTPLDARRRLSATAHPGVTVHWNGIDPEGSPFVVGLDRAVVDVVCCQRLDFAFVVVESALKTHPRFRAMWPSHLSGMSSGARRILQHATALSGSGTESMFAFRMRRLVLQSRLFGASSVF